MRGCRGVLRPGRRAGGQGDRACPLCTLLRLARGGGARPRDVYSEKPPRSGSTLPPRKRPSPSHQGPLHRCLTTGGDFGTLTYMGEHCDIPEAMPEEPASAPPPSPPTPRLPLVQATGMAPLPPAWRQPGPLAAPFLVKQAGSNVLKVIGIRNDLNAKCRATTKYIRTHQPCERSQNH